MNKLSWEIRLTCAVHITEVEPKRTNESADVCRVECMEQRPVTDSWGTPQITFHAVVDLWPIVSYRRDCADINGSIVE